jgi:hypothetical protein
VHQLARGHRAAEAAADDDRVESGRRLHGPKLVGDGRLEQSLVLGLAKEQR